MNDISLFQLSLPRISHLCLLSLLLSWKHFLCFCFAFVLCKPFHITMISSSCTETFLNLSTSNSTILFYCDSVFPPPFWVFGFKNSICTKIYQIYEHIFNPHYNFRIHLCKCYLLFTYEKKTQTAVGKVPGPALQLMAVKPDVKGLCTSCQRGHLHLSHFLPPSATVYLKDKNTDG